MEAGDWEHVCVGGKGWNKLKASVDIKKIWGKGRGVLARSSAGYMHARMYWYEICAY